MRADNQNRLSLQRSQSQMLKKSILWNVVEPGDPYDIKKSMIARLPGDNRPFMGNKLQLVCLLQAAEIERLALNLQEYRVRFNEVEKGSLDRHSYEVQIKELAAKVQNQQILKSENAKLKKFSERLNQQLEQTKLKYSSGNTQLNQNYEQALLQIQTLSEKHEKITTENNNLKVSLSSKITEIQEMEKKMMKLQESIEHYNEDLNKMEEYEQKFSMISEEIQRLNSVLKQKTQENYFLNEELKQHKGYALSKKEENQLLRGTQQKLSEQLSSLKSRLQKAEQQHKHYQQQQRYVYQFKDQLQRAGSQIQRLNSMLAKLQSQKQQLYLLLQKNEEKVNYYSNTLNQKNTWIEQLQQTNTKYENNSALIGREVQRLNGVLKNKLDELNTLQTKFNRITEENQFYSSQISVLEKQNKQCKQIKRQVEELQFDLSNQQASNSKLNKVNNDLMKRINELSIETQKYTSFQQKMSTISLQLQQSNERIDQLKRQNKSLQSRVKESDNLQAELNRNRKQLAELKNLMHQQDINKKNLNDRISDLNRKSNQYQKLISELSSEIHRLNQILKTKLIEGNQLENRVSSLKAQNSKLQEIIAKNTTEKTKLEDYQNKFALISLQIERLNNNIKLKVNEKAQADRQNEILKRENNNLKQQLNDYSLQLNKVKYAQQNQEMKLIQYKNEIHRLNQVIKVRLEEMNAQVARLTQENNQLKYQMEQVGNKDRELADLQRLNSLLRLKVQESSKWQASNSQLLRKIQYVEDNLNREIQENRQIKLQLQKITSERNQAFGQLNEYKAKVHNILQEVERLHQILQSLKTQNNDLKQQLFHHKKQSSSNLTYKQKNDKLLKEIERLNVIIQEQKLQLKQLRVLLSQDYALDRRLKQQLSLMVVLFAQIETLRRRIDDKEKEIQVVRRESLVALKD